MTPQKPPRSKNNQLPANGVAEMHMTLPATDPSADRLIYAGFPVPLKDAMKIAAQRWHWDRETWRYQTLLLQDALTRILAADLATAYAQPPETV